MSWGSKKLAEDMEEGVQDDYADLIDLLLSILTTKDGDFVTVAGDVPARTRWRVARMASRWKGEVERLHAESQQVIDNCLRRAAKKHGVAREVELQTAAKHVQYINQLSTGYAEIRRLANIIWPLQGMTLVKHLRSEGRVKTAAAIGQRGGAVVNDMLEKYMAGASIPSISEAVTTQMPRLPTPREPIEHTPTPETHHRMTKEERESIKEMLENTEELEITDDGRLIPVEPKEAQNEKGTEEETTDDAEETDDNNREAKETREKRTEEGLTDEELEADLKLENKDTENTEDS